MIFEPLLNMPNKVKKSLEKKSTVQCTVFERCEIKKFGFSFFPLPEQNLDHSRLPEVETLKNHY